MIKIHITTKKYLSATLLLLFLPSLYSTLYTMEQINPTAHIPSEKNNPYNKWVWIQTRDSHPILAKRKNIKSMKRLQVLFEHQKGTNSKENPLAAAMVNTHELTLLKNALHAVRHNSFDQFYHNLADKDGITLNQFNNTIGNGNLRSLINATNTVEATTLRTLYASLLFCSDTQKQITHDLLKPIKRYLENKIIAKNMANKGVLLNNGAAGVQSAIISPNGKMIIVGFYWSKNNIELWDASTKKLIKGLRSEPGSAEILVCNAQSTMIACGYNNTRHTLELWDISDLEHIRYVCLPNHPANVSCLALSPDGTMLVSGCHNMHINLFLWDISAFPDVKKIADLKGHRQNITGATFSADSKKIISCANDQNNNLIEWDISDIKKIRSRSLPGHDIRILHCALSPDTTKLAYCSTDKKVTIADIRDITKINSKFIHKQKQGVSNIEFSHDSTRLILGVYCNRNKIIITDVHTIHNAQTIAYGEYDDHINSVTFSPDGNYVMARCGRKTNNILIWTLFTPQERAVLEQLHSLNIAHVLSVSNVCNTSVCNQHVFATLPSEIQTLLKIPVKKLIP